MTGMPADAKSGLEFTGPARILSNDMALLDFDYVLVNGERSGVTVTLVIMDAQGEILKTVPSINAPTGRSRVTTLTGEFLTRDYPAGVVIDPGFDGTIEVVIP